MNKQEVFNKVATHLLTQKRQARTEHGECAYRTKSGLMCAIGALIADEHFNPEFNSAAADDHGVLAALYKSGVISAEEADAEMGHDSHNFLNGLQTVHDSNDPQYWKSELGYFAKRHDLDASVLNNF